MSNEQGFSQGMCEASCEAGTLIDEHGVCAPFFDIDGFQDCVRDGGAWLGCADAMTYAMAARACDAHKPCRPDYTCMRTGVMDESGSEVGACFPNYIVMQLRTDGYPR